MGDLTIGAQVVFFIAIASQGVDVNAEGVIVSPHGEHLILPDEFKDSDGTLVDANYVHVRVFGKVLMVPDFVFTAPAVAEVKDGNGSSGDGSVDVAQQSSTGIDAADTVISAESNSSAVDASANDGGSSGKPVSNSTAAVQPTDSASDSTASASDQNQPSASVNGIAANVGVASGGTDGANTAASANDVPSTVQVSAGNAVTNNGAPDAGSACNSIAGIISDLKKFGDGLQDSNDVALLNNIIADLVKVSGVAA